MPPLGGARVPLIRFDWPWAFALVLLPLAARLLLPRAPVAGALRLPIGGEFAAVLGPERATVRRIAPAAVAAWLLLLLAAAQPVWTGATLTLPVHARDVLLVIDISGSMSEKDVDFADPTLSRLQAVQQVAGQFIERREGDRVGLVLFGTRAYVYSPLSLDRATVAALLAEADVGLAGEATAIGDAVTLGVRHLRRAAAGERVMILLTDGENTAGSVPPLTAAALAAREGVRVHTIGFGSERASTEAIEVLGLHVSRVEEEPLRRIARETGGQYFRARNRGELERVYGVLDGIEPAPVETRSFRPERALFHWPLAAAVALFAFVALRRRAW